MYKICFYSNVLYVYIACAVGCCRSNIILSLLGTIIINTIRCNNMYIVTVQNNNNVPHKRKFNHATVLSVCFD